MIAQTSAVNMDAESGNLMEFMSNGSMGPPRGTNLSVYRTIRYMNDIDC